MKASAGPTKRIPSVLVVCLLLVFSMVQRVAPCIGITNAHMEVFPRKAGTSATYKFIFTIEKKLAIHDDIVLVWPPGTTINPPLPEDEQVRNERLIQIMSSISIGFTDCTTCKRVPSITKLSDGSIKLVFKAQVGLDPSFPGVNPVVVTVPDVCGFTNPPREGNYIYKVATKPEPSLTPCKPFMIVESKLGEPDGKPVVVADPPVFSLPAAYTISFQVGRGGWLKQEVGLIKVRFPIGTRISIPPGDIKPAYITINGNPLARPPNGTKQSLNFPVPVEIKDSGKVTLQIDSRAGIINPSTPGEYHVEVATSGDPDWVFSSPYSIVKTASLFSIKPPKINRIAEYSLSYVQEDTDLSKGDSVDFIFPDSVTLPANLLSNTVLVNQIPCLSAIVDKQLVKIVIDRDIYKNEGVEIRFLTEAGIKNPSVVGPIRISFKPKGVTDFQQSSLVMIVEQKLEVTDIIVNPPNAKEIASYQLKITFGDQMLLIPGDKITVLFPFLATPIVVDVNETLPQDYVLLLDTIQNPEPGRYQLKMNTSKENELITSDYFTILPPLPITNIQVTEGKIGKDDWYTDPPIISFTCSDPTAQIYLWWDDNKNDMLPYLSSKPLDPGQYRTRLHYFAKTAYGSEKPQVIEIKVDTFPPEIVMESPKELQTLTREKTISVFGRSTLIKTVVWGADTFTYDKIIRINDKYAPVSDKDGTFSIVLDLTEGENKITIHAEDTAGNVAEKEFSVLLDTKAPAIQLKSPAEGATIAKNPIFVTGKTEPSAELLINGETAYVEEDGAFSQTIVAKTPGELKIELTATDPSGNITQKSLFVWYGYTITLQIGNLRAKTNGVVVDLSLAPLIQKGYTLIPFRFIGEQLKATISFVQDSKTNRVNSVTYELDGVKIYLTIGSQKADINGKSVTLEVAPRIISGYTLIPIRFVSENLGCNLDWEAKTQTITIQYPNH